jgi:hypothetical protein
MKRKTYPTDLSEELKKEGGEFILGLPLGKKARKMLMI